jgi:hypothetical protein
VLGNGDYVWSGNVNSDWSNASNWLVCNGNSFSVAAAVPTSTNNVYVRAYAACATNTATTPSAASVNCKNLTIEATKSLTAGNLSQLNVYGNWSNSGTFTAGNGTVIFAGSATQSINAGASSFYNVTVNNTTVGNNDINVTAPMIITNIGSFNDGILYYSGTGQLTFTQGAVCPNGGSNTSFVNTAGAGYVSKTGTNGFIFPVGEISVAGVPVWAPVEIAAPAVNSTITANYNFSAAPNNWDPSNMCDVNVINHTSGVEHWIMTTTASTPAITLYWKNGSRSGITSAADILVAHWENCGGTDRWVSKGATVTGNATSGSVTSTVPFTSYSPITFGTRTGNNPLPVSLLNFSATCSDADVKASWSTASETNNDFFTLEKSSDMESWELVQTIQGAGNSNDLLEYTATDYFASEGMHYYRLKQTDYDGQFTYSSVVMVDCGIKSHNEVNVYPNPASDQLNISLIQANDGPIVVKVFNMMGLLVETKEVVAQQTVTLQLELSDYATGTYSYTITTTGETFSGQFIKIASDK